MTEKETPTPPEVGHTKDTRGKLVTLIDPFVMHRLGRHDTIPAEPLAEIAREIGSGWARRHQIACLIAWALPLTVIAITWIAKLHRGTPLGSLERNVVVILVANFALGTCIIWWWARRNRMTRIRTIMLKHLRCPHCGYDIRGLPVDPQDDVTVCPECGCAWLLPSETR